MKRIPSPAAAAPDPLQWAAHSKPGILLAKPNYSFEKRQRELAKKKKKEEKAARKRAERDADNPTTAAAPEPPPR